MTLNIPPLRGGTAGALLTAVPYLLGFRPENSLVVLCSASPSRPAGLILRYELPGQPDREEAAVIAGHLDGVLARYPVVAVILAGYGPGELVTPVMDAARAALASARVQVRDALRVHEGRYWSYVCADPACCPPAGVSLDPAANPAAAMIDAAARAAGLAPALSSRAELAATIGPLTGPVATAMARATERAERTVSRITARDGARAVYRPGLAAVRQAIGVYREGGELRPDARHAWLSVVLSVMRVRDDAWTRMDPAHAPAHLRLWTDVARRARPGYAAAPASLLAFTAWQLGDGVLASLALDRALEDTPGYAMATLLREAVDAGLPPASAVPPITPEEVADSYDDPASGGEPGSG